MNKIVNYIALLLLIYSVNILVAAESEKTPENTTITSGPLCDVQPKPICDIQSPRAKWITVYETEKVTVPVCEVVEVPVEKQVKVMRKIEKEIEVPITTCVTTTKEIVTKKPITENVEVTENVEKKIYIDEVRVKQVNKTRVIPAEKVVGKVKYSKVHDTKGNVRRVRRINPEVVATKVKEHYQEDETYFAKVPVTVNQPVTKIRKVTKWIDEVKTVEVPSKVTTVGKKTITTLEPTYETKTVMQKQYVKTDKLVDRQIKKKIKVYE